MGRLIRAFDWASGPLGSVERWPQSLRTAVSIMLGSHNPIYLAWGPQFVQLYNDAYRPILGGTKHPAALGQPAEICFAEIWDFIGPIFQRILQGGEAVGYTDQLVPLHRFGFSEECYFTFSYSRIPDDHDGVGGVFVTCLETTATVLRQRRLKTLKEIAAQPHQIRHERDALRRVQEVLNDNRPDLPFACLFAHRDNGVWDQVLEHESAQLQPELRRKLSALIPPPSKSREAYPAGLAPVEISDPDHLRPLLSDPLTQETVDHAVVVSIVPPGSTGPELRLVVGLSPRLKFDENYQQFLTVLGREIATVVANSRAADTLRLAKEELESRVIERTSELAEVVEHLQQEVKERKQSEATVNQLLQINHVLNSTLDPDALLDALVNEAISLVGAESGWAGLRDAEDMVCRRYQQNGKIIPHEYHFPPGHGLPGRMILNPQPYLTNNVGGDPHFVPALAQRFDVRHAICLPITDRHREVIGFFELHNKQAPEGFTFVDQNRLLAVAQSASLAVQNALAYRKMAETEAGIQKFNQRLLNLSQTVQRLSSAHDLETILRITRAAARKLLAADGVTVVLREGDQCHYVDEDAIAPLWKGKRFPMEACISGWVMQQNQPACIADIDQDPRIPAEAYRPTFVKSLAMFPLREGNPLGALGCYWAHPHTPTAEEQQIIELLAGTVARTIDGVRTYTALKQSEERLRLMIDSVEDYAIILLDSTGHVTSWNHGAERIKGYSATEIIGQNFSIFYEPEDQAAGLPDRILTDALRAGHRKHEGWRVRKDGSRFWGDVVISAVRDGDGKLLGFVKVTRDMTERRNADEALRRSNFALQSIFDAAPVALLSFDLNGHITSWSAGAERMFGWSEAESMGRIIPIVAPDDLTDFMEMTARVAQSGPEELVRIRITKDGRHLTAKLNPAPLHDQDGNVNGVMVILEDITEKKKAEAAKRQSEQELRKVAQALEQERTRLAEAQALANVGSWETDLVSQNVLWSEQNFRIFEQDRSCPALSHADFLNLVHPLDQKKVDDAFTASLKTRHQNQIEHRILLPGGRIKVIETRWRVFHDHDGRPVRASGTTQDISTRRQAEETLLVYQRQFEVLFRNSPIAIGYGAFRDGKIIDVNHKLAELFGWNRDEIVGRTMDELSPFSKSFAWRDLLRRTVWLNRRGQYQVRLLRRSGEEFDGVVSFERLILRRELVLAVMILDVTELNAAKRDSIVRAHQQSGLAALSQQALAKDSLPAVLDAVVAMLARTMKVKYCKVLQLMPDDHRLKLVAGVGWLDGLVGSAIVGTEKNSQAGFTLQFHEPVVVKDLRRDTRFNGPALLNDHGIISGVSVIIGEPNAPWGVLGVHSASRRDFSTEDISFLCATANLLGTTIKRANAERSVQKLYSILLHAENAERRRIARELHDSSVQDLVSAMMNLQILRETKSRGGDQEALRLEDSLALLEKCAHDIRTLSYRLHPPRLDDVGLASAIRYYVKGFGERTKLTIHQHLPEEIHGLEDPTKLALFRVVQEALANIHRHSQSKSATVQITLDKTRLVLEVTDDGVGLPAEWQDPNHQPVAAGVGIASMRERVRLINGQFEIKSSPVGTSVRAILPLNNTSR